jgi:hypothetical protein
MLLQDGHCSSQRGVISEGFVRAAFFLEHFIFPNHVELGDGRRPRFVISLSTFCIKICTSAHLNSHREFCVVIFAFFTFPRFALRSICIFPPIFSEPKIYFRIIVASAPTPSEPGAEGVVVQETATDQQQEQQESSGHEQIDSVASPTPTAAEPSTSGFSSPQRHEIFFIITYDPFPWIATFGAPVRKSDQVFFFFLQWWQ